MELAMKRSLAVNDKNAIYAIVVDTINEQVMIFYRQ